MKNSAIAFTEGSVALLPSPRRGEGGARGALDEGAACPACRGMGVIFRCPEWDASLGECCPAGTHRQGCPGKSIACAACAGTGRAA